MSKKRVGVLRGGPSSEYEVSLKTGKTVIDNLLDKYEVLDILIDKAGIWHFEGRPITPEKVFQKVDVIFNAMHGEYGEDGQVQKLLDYFSIPYTGSTSMPSAVAMNKLLTKKIYKDHKIKTPLHVTVSKDDDLSKEAIKLFKTFSMPAVVKPATSGSSLGVSIVKTLAQMEPALEHALKYSKVAMIEEFIAGREASCGVIDGFRNEEIYSLLPAEIGENKDDGEFFDYHAKYVSEAQEVICPGNFSQAEKKIMQEMAKNAHKVLGLRHYSRSDFRIHPKRGIYILETNTLPGLTSHSIVPKSLKEIGCTLPDFFEHLIESALAGR